MAESRSHISADVVKKVIVGEWSDEWSECLQHKRLLQFESQNISGYAVIIYYHINKISLFHSLSSCLLVKSVPYVGEDCFGNSALAICLLFSSEACALFRSCCRVWQMASKTRTIPTISASISLKPTNRR